MKRSYAGTISLRRKGSRVVLTIAAGDLEKGLMLPSLFGVRSVHFGTKLRGMNILKGEGYGWDGRDRVRAKRRGKAWVMAIPVRDNDPKRKARRFVRGNCYIRTHHNEIHYFDLRKWRLDPEIARQPGIIDIDFEKIPSN